MAVDLKQQDVWQYAHQLCLDVLTMTRSWPRNEAREWVEHMRQLAVITEQNVVKACHSEDPAVQKEAWTHALEAVTQINESTGRAVQHGLATDQEAKHALQRSGLVVKTLKRKLGLEVGT